MEFTYFTKELTTQSSYFEIGLLLFVIGILFYGLRNYRFFLWRFSALLFGVFCFEGLTGAMWINAHLGNYAYIHNDISWVMTVTWASIIMITRFIFDRFFQKGNLLREFLFVVIFSSIVGLLLLVYLKAIGVFSYSPEMQELVSSGITFFGRPLEAIIYFPTFIFLTYSFYKYWELAMYNKNLFINAKINFKKDFLLATLVIFSIGYIFHPLLPTTHLLNYIYIIMLFVIILIITSFVINLTTQVPLFIRFISGSAIFTILGIFIFSFFVQNGLIYLSDSIKETYTVNTISIPFTVITDVEGIGILLFSYLLIASVKYFKVISDNKNISLSGNTMTFKGWKSLFYNIQ